MKGVNNMELLKLILRVVVDFIALFEIFKNIKLEKELSDIKRSKLVYKAEISKIPRDYEKEEENHLMGDR